MSYPAHSENERQTETIARLCFDGDNSTEVLADLTSRLGVVGDTFPTA